MYVCMYTSRHIDIHTPDDGRLAVAPQRVFEEERELGVAVVHVPRLAIRHVRQRHDHVAQRRQRPAARMSERARCDTRVWVCAVCTSMYRKERCTDVDTDAGTRMNTDTQMEHIFHTHTHQPTQDLLILEASLRRSPEVCVDFCRSLPARSTRLRHDARVLVTPSGVLCSLTTCNARACVYDLRDTPLTLYHTHNTHTLHIMLTHIRLDDWTTWRVRSCLL